MKRELRAVVGPLTEGVVLRSSASSMHFFSNVRGSHDACASAHATHVTRAAAAAAAEASSSSSCCSSHTSGSNSASPFFTISASSHHAVRTPARRLRMRTLGLRALGAADLRGCHRAARVCGRTFTLPLMYQPFCRIILTWSTGTCAGFAV